jgi:hypothetical protein
MSALRATGRGRVGPNRCINCEDSAQLRTWRDERATYMKIPGTSVGALAKPHAGEVGRAPAPSFVRRG